MKLQDPESIKNLFSNWKYSFLEFKSANEVLDKSSIKLNDHCAVLISHCSYMSAVDL